ncbi:MAG: phage BR0599 family protein [Sphingomonadales bacterium]|nr:phage BR0599 family protein [Sphingomonadales bacterium]MDE2171171.1 phage BR0599 family protein [Sphingomonadales bacterium]
MKASNPALQALLQSNTRLPFADCFTLITNVGADVSALQAAALGNPAGQTYFWTNSDADVQDGNTIYSSAGPRLKGANYKCSVGLSVDQQTIEIFADNTDTLMDGTPILAAIGAGYLDGARFIQRRAFFDPTTWPSRPGDPNQAVGSVITFSGRATTPQDVGRTAAQVIVKTDLLLLDIEMPRNHFEPNCRNTLFDGQCGLNRSLYEVSAAAASGSSKSIVLWPNSYPVNNFMQGMLRFTTGPNAGLSRAIRASGTTGLTLVYPLLYPPAAGDSFVVYPGCDHTLTTCQSKFMNNRNFLGYPFTPPPSAAV